MIIFTKSELLNATYCEILKEYNPSVFNQKEDFLSALNTARLAIIDEDIDILNQVRSSNLNISVLFIAKNATISEDISYLQKPLSSSLLLSKVNLLWTRIQKGMLSCFSTTKYTFNAVSRTLNDINLTQKETEMIEYLYENKGKIISKEELLKQIFGYKDGVETHTVETHIYKLRQKINDDENGLISTKEGGYTINLK
jgi:DNA-binding response OmpR family regulator